MAIKYLNEAQEQYKSFDKECEKYISRYCKGKDSLINTVQKIVNTIDKLVPLIMVTDVIRQISRKPSLSPETADVLDNLTKSDKEWLQKYKELNREDLDVLVLHSYSDLSKIKKLKTNLESARNDISIQIRKREVTRDDLIAQNAVKQLGNLPKEIDEFLWFLNRINNSISDIEKVLSNIKTFRELYEQDQRIVTVCQEQSNKIKTKQEMEDFIAFTNAIEKISGIDSRRLYCENWGNIKKEIRRKEIKNFEHATELVPEIIDKKIAKNAEETKKLSLRAVTQRIRKI